MLEDKIQASICETIMPLYEIWKSKANWTDEEALVIYHKLFDSEKPSDIVIQDILADTFGKSYLYYHPRKINRIFKSARKKLNKILP